MIILNVYSRPGSYKESINFKERGQLHNLGRRGDLIIEGELSV